LFDFVSKRKWFFLGSGAVILIGIISLIVSGLNLGLDFKPGVTMTLVFSEPVEQESLRASLAEIGYSEAVIQHSPKDAFLLEDFSPAPQEKEQLAEELQAEFGTTTRTAEFASEGAGNGTLALIFGKTVSEADLVDELDNLGYGNITFTSASLDSFLIRIGEREEQDSGAAATNIPEQDRIKEALRAEFGALDYLEYDSISQAVASERVRYTGYAMLVAAIGILLYIAWSFRKLVSSFRFGVCAVLALVHDVLIVLTVFSLFRLEVNSMFIIAVLTVIGYGVNNIIVVFDRIRENRSRHLNATFDTTVNISITETLTRSLNTSLTTLFVLLALALFGGSTIYNFVLALIVGVVACTYSSLFIASQLLVAWDHGELAQLFKWIPIRRKES
jgi:preprotein translocase subunit SecF